MTPLIDMPQSNRMSQLMPESKFPVEQPADYQLMVRVQTPAKGKHPGIVRIAESEKISNAKERKKVSVILK